MGIGIPILGPVGGAIWGRPGGDGDLRVESLILLPTGLTAYS